jgi:hypothetical protein
MRVPGVQRDGKNEATITSTLAPPPLVMANKSRAPVVVLSPTKRTAVIECFNNNGLHKRNGYWCGAPEGKHISGVTVADLARDGMFSVITNLRSRSARLTERGQGLARTLIEASGAQRLGSNASV